MRRKRMLGRDRAEGRAHERVRTRREYAEHVLRACELVRKADPHAFAAPDPVRLHRAHALRPLGHVVELVEQVLRVLRDAQVVHRDLALLDRRAGAPAAAVDHLLVREHRLVDRVPVDDAGLLVRNAALEHAQEEPLVPAVVLGLAGRQLAIPVEGEAELLQLALHVGDVVVGPLRRRDLVLDRGVLGRQAERVPAHRLQDVVALHAHVAGQHVAHGVVAHVAHMQPPAGVRKHAQAVVLAARGVFGDGKGAPGRPKGLGVALNSGVVVSFLHRGRIADGRVRLKPDPQRSST